MNTPKTQPVKKITLGLISKDESGEKRAPSDIAKRRLRVIGRVNGFRKTSKNFGDRQSESTGFRGVFEASETINGEITQTWRATELFLPGFLDSELCDAFTQAASQDDSLSGASVDIAKVRKDLAVGYEWMADNLLPPTNDPFASIRTALASAPTPTLEG